MADSIAQNENVTIKTGTIKDMYFIFEIDGEDYGVEVAYVKEIVPIGIKKITKVPHLPNYIEGIVNLRGDIIGVLSVRKRFGKESKEYDEKTCIIVLDLSQLNLGLLGLIVDSVNAAYTIPHEDISAPPSAKLNNHNQFIRNIGRTVDGVKLLIDLEKFLEQ